MTSTQTTKINHNFLGVMAALVALALAMSSLLEEARPAKAAFPGDNGKIAFASTRTTGTGVDNPEGDYEIFTMNKDGTGITQLTKNTANDYSPSFSADGSVLVFTSERDGNKEIYLMSSDGRSQFCLTNNTTTENRPTISPDGSKIAFSSYRNFTPLIPHLQVFCRGDERTRTADLLITSERSAVSGCCRGLQNPHT